jgi:lysozyme
MKDALKMEYSQKDMPLSAAFWLTRDVNDDGVALVKEFEGLHLTPYMCPAKVWSIGYGHTSGVRMGMNITPEEADALLQQDLKSAAFVVTRLVKVPLNENQYAALASFVFNVGEGNFEQSTLLKLLNRGWYEQVPAQLMRWNRANNEVLGGLARRRAAEGRLWNKPVGDA